MDKKLINLLDESIKNHKKLVTLTYKLKLSLFVKEIKDGNEKVLVQRFRDYLMNPNDISVYYKLERSQLFAICELLTSKRKLTRSQYCRLIPKDTYIIIGDNNQNNRIIENLELDGDKFVVRC